jgi:hypothetical protein
VEWLWRAGGVLACLAICVAWTLLPWQWSLIDDPGLRISALDAWDHGLGGLWSHFTDQWTADRSWGLFRPGYWAYLVLFYLLPVGAAHGMRLALLLVVLIIPPLAVRRRVGRATDANAIALWVGLALIANRSIFNGLSWLSVQELPGAALVACGFSARRDTTKFVCFLVAAWFKPAFIWLALAFVVDLVRRRRLRTAVMVAPLALATLGLILWFSHGGSYTHVDLSLANASGALQAFGRQAVVVVVVIALGFVAFRVGPRDLVCSAALTYALGGAAYLAQLMVWSGRGTYLYSAPVLLFTLAVASVFESSAATRPVVSSPRGLTLIALAASAVAALVVGWVGVTRTFQRDAAVRLIADYAAHQPAPVTIAVTDVEGAIRLQQIEQLDHPGWQGRFIYIAPGTEPPASATYLAKNSDTDVSPPPSGWCQVTSTDRARIYERC